MFCGAADAGSFVCLTYEPGFKWSLKKKKKV